MNTGIKVALGVLGALLILVLVAAFGSGGGGFFGQGPMMGQGGMMGQAGMMGQGGWGAWGILWMLVMLLVPLLFFGGLIALIAWAVAHLTSGRHGESTVGPREDSAEEILRQRFARGEIDAKEYEERRRTLGRGA